MVAIVSCTQCPDFVFFPPVSAVATAATVTSAPGRAATGGVVRPAGDRDRDEILETFSRHERL